MSRDLQQGDEFAVAAERSTAPTGAMRIGKVIAATFKLSGNNIDAVRYESGSVSGEYFDQEGKSMRAAFLRAPLEFRRISSFFGMRKHPILGDFVSTRAPTTRRIRARRCVQSATACCHARGWGNGYGNVLEIRHRNGYVTRYGHLRGFASDVHVGSHVSIGQTVAYVGTTGLSTGAAPAFRGAGEWATARSAFGTQSRPAAIRFPRESVRAFSELRDRLLASIGTPTAGVAKLAVH